MRKFTWMMLPAALMLLATQAIASSFSVTPILAAIPAPQKIATYTLNNAGAAPLQVQVSGWTWSQQNGDDVYAPADALTISPPVVVVPAGGSQIIRIARPAGGANAEQAFRLHFDEVPSGVTESGVVLHTVLRLDVPLFFTTDRKTRPSTRWTVSATGSPGQLAIGANNSGNRFDRYSALALYDAAGAPLVRLSQPLYVLAGNSRVWTKDMAHPVKRGDTVRLVLEQDGATLEQRITVE